MSKNNSLVLLGGMMCDRKLWAKQCSDLKVFFDKIIVGDLTRSSSIKNMAQDVISEAPERFALAGFSMGGVVAFEIWREAPERITHLALFDTNAAPEKPERQASRQAEIERAYDGRLRDMMVQEFIPKWFGRRSRVNAGVLDTILDMALGLGVHVFERQSLALRDRTDSRPTLGTINCPTIVVCGREDSVCPPHDHEFMANGIPDAELTILDDCGHMPPLERPDDVTRLLLDLTQQQEPRQKAAV